MAAGYNLISVNPSVFPSIHGYTGALPTGAVHGSLVYINGDISQLYTLKTENQVFNALFDSLAWVHLHDQTYTINSIIVNGVEYLSEPISILRLIINDNYFSVAGFTATPAVYAGANTYNNWVKFINDTFISLGVPLEAKMYQHATYGANLMHISCSLGDTFNIEVQNESSIGTDDYIYNLELTATEYNAYVNGILQGTIETINDYDDGSNIAKMGWFDTLSSGLGSATSLALYEAKGGFYIEDGIIAEYSQFWIDTAKDVLIQELKLKLLAYNNLTQSFFELDSFVIPIANTVVVGGVQQFNINTIRGFKLASGDQFNYVKIIKGSLVGTKQYYRIIVALKLTWADWQKQLDADTVFYDSTKPNNNLNKKSSNYSEKQSYSIKISLSANVTGLNSLGVQGQTDYELLSPPLKIRDYDESDNWSCEIETVDFATATPLIGAILTDRYTEIQVEFTKLTGVIGAIEEYCAIIRLEKTGQNGLEIYELSSLRSSMIDNLLILNPNEDIISIGDTTTINANCLIDYTKLESGSSYNISSRLIETPVT